MDRHPIDVRCGTALEYRRHSSDRANRTPRQRGVGSGVSGPLLVRGTVISTSDAACRVRRRLLNYMGQLVSQQPTAALTSGREAAGAEHNVAADPVRVG